MKNLGFGLVILFCGLFKNRQIQIGMTISGLLEDEFDELELVLG